MKFLAYIILCSMKITQVKIKSHLLKFRFEAGTSRGTLTNKETWYLQLFNENSLLGIGEAGPLKGLSVDPLHEMEREMHRVGDLLTGKELPNTIDDVFEVARSLASEKFPSIRFAIETALLDALHEGKKEIFPTAFFESEKRIPINGLIWMGDENFMQQQIKEKLEAGFSTIKMKIGAIDFDTEVKLLKSIRSKFNADQITLRVDANGAFSPDEALEKLNVLAEFDIHSIEQPIKAGQLQEMKQLCIKSRLPIALDEELIGVNSVSEKQKLLQSINPQFIILKPSLIGGIQSVMEWTKVAEDNNIKWWLTSMLESNIGLNAICQLAAHLNVSMPQGLGTGQLYHNNISSPLTIENGEIYYDQKASWDSV